MATAPIALTLGEPAGIGPEIAVGAWTALKDELDFFVIGDPTHLPKGTKVKVIEAPEEAHAAMATALPVLAHAFPGPRVPAQPNPAHARHVIGTIENAVELVQAGRASALTTGPIHKKALKDGAKFRHPGHTEFLAHLAGVLDVAMMLVGEGLRTVPVTIHIPLAEVPKALSPYKLEHAIRVTHKALRQDFGIARPRIAVSGLNPHAGEGGAMGDEEEEIIEPVLTMLRGEGYDIAGPLAADTMFHPAARASYDVAICMYHDQALIPVKTLDFAGGVNVTLGLPFIRTSPDHGTAFDIAGKGTADPASLISALRLARDMAATRAGTA